MPTIWSLRSGDRGDPPSPTTHRAVDRKHTVNLPCCRTSANPPTVATPSMHLSRTETNHDQDPHYQTPKVAATWATGEKRVVPMKTIESHQIRPRPGTHPQPPSPVQGDAPPGLEGLNSHPPKVAPPPGKATDDDGEGGGYRSGQGIICEEEGKPGSSRGEEQEEAGAPHRRRGPAGGRRQ